MRPGLLPVGSHVLVACSGGGDSTALLHLLHDLRGERRLQLSAACFDHALRTGSDLESARTAERCEMLGIACRLGRPPGDLAPTHASMRRARYGFLTTIANQIGATRIVTGHHADDQAETVLLRIARGTGVRGLAGIPERRGRIVRPLLGIRRAELRAYLERRCIPFEVDPSNRDPRWARSRVRHLLLPALARALDRDPVPDLLVIAEAAEAVERRLERAGQELLRRSRVSGRDGAVAEFDRSVWLESPSPVRAAAVRHWARGHDMRLGRGGTRAAVEFITRGRSGGYVIPVGGMRVSRSFGVVRLECDAPSDSGVRSTNRTLPSGPPYDGATEAPDAVEIRGGAGQRELAIGGRSLRVRWTPADGSAQGRSGAARQAPGRVAVAVGPGHFPLWIRGWRPGDRIRLAGGTRKLKKLFCERRVPLRDRETTPVLVDRSGRVIWVAGLDLAEWARPRTAGAGLWIEIVND